MTSSSVTDPAASVAAQPVSDAAVAPMAPPAGAPSPPRRAVPEERADAIHLGSAVGPVLMSRYGIPVAWAGAAAIGYLLGRGRSRSGGA